MSNKCDCVGVGTCKHGNTHRAEDVEILLSAQLTPSNIKEFKKEFPPIKKWSCKNCGANNKRGVATCKECGLTPLRNFRGNQ